MWKAVYEEEEEEEEGQRNSFPYYMEQKDEHVGELPHLFAEPETWIAQWFYLFIHLLGMCFLWLYVVVFVWDDSRQKYHPLLMLSNSIWSLKPTVGVCVCVFVMFCLFWACGWSHPEFEVGWFSGLHWSKKPKLKKKKWKRENHKVPTFSESHGAHRCLSNMWQDLKP